MKFSLHTIIESRFEITYTYHHIHVPPHNHHHTVQVAWVLLSGVFAPVAGRKNTTSASCFGASWSGLHQQGTTTATTITNEIRTSIDAVGVIDAAIKTTCVRINVCPYTSCIDCSISYSNSTHAGLDLVGDGGGCSCVLLVQPTPTCTVATCTGSVFPSVNWRKYSTCKHGDDHLLQLALVVFFLLSLTKKAAQ